jgi:biotin carboxylase
VAAGRGDAPKRLLVLGAGPAQLGLLAAARERGLYVVAADRDPGAVGFAYADRRALVSTEDEEGIDRLAEAESVEGLIAPGIDWPVAIAARIAQRRGVTHPVSPETAVLATSKLKQRERFREAGVPQPRWELCRSLEEVEAAAGRLGLPVVVKAPDRQGQRGLGLVRTPEELEPAAREALEAARTATAIVERYAPGRELTVNAILVDGRFQPLTITDRLVADPPAFGVALAHVWPSALPAETVTVACDAAAQAAAALEIERGPVYVQVLAGDEGPQVIELAARVGGGHDAELCRAALGVDLNSLALAAALGEEVPEEELRPEPRVGGACVRFLVPPAGSLAQVTGIEEAAVLPGIELVRIYRRPGHVFGPFRRGADRAGAILAVGDSRDDALAHAAAAAEAIRFELAPPDELLGTPL